eukprot:6905699-Prymnesium_polylepis.2
MGGDEVAYIACGEPREKFEKQIAFCAPTPPDRALDRPTKRRHHKRKPTCLEARRAGAGREGGVRPGEGE